MLINDLNLDTEKLKGNPAINISEMTIKQPYSYPDPYFYFILSSAGRDFKVLSNNSILLNPSKGYYTYPFSLDFNQADVISLSSELFKNTKPLEGEAAIALKRVLKRSERITTKFLNRL